MKLGVTRSVCWTAVLGTLAASSAMTAENHPLHRYLETVPSPDGVSIASVEGDVPPSGREPTIRDLVIRRMDGANVATVSLPCGRVRECWPASLAWTPDGKQLTFALRTP